MSYAPIWNCVSYFILLISRTVTHSSSKTVTSRRGGPGLEDELAGVVAVHGEVGEDLAHARHEDGGRHDAAVDAEQEEQADDQHGGAEEHVVHQGREEGYLQLGNFK